MGERAAVPLRRSLVLRLFALVTAVAVVAVGLTAWLTVRTTAVGLRQEQGEAVRAGARVEDALHDYAATHPSWSQVGPLVDRLARAGSRITLVGADGRVLADSADGEVPVPDGPSTVIDVFDVAPVPDPVPDQAAQEESPGPAPVDQCPSGGVCEVVAASTVGPPPGASPIDPRVVGPFALTAAEAAESHALARRVASCLTDELETGTQVVDRPSGRSSVTSDGLPSAGPQPSTSPCDLRALQTPYESERAPLARTQQLVTRCLARASGPVVTLMPDLGWSQAQPRTPSSDRLVTACLTAARRQVLAPYAAPAARLFVSSTRQEPTSFLDLSTGNRLRIGGVVLLVLVLSLGFAALAGRQLVRPLAVLATAAGRVREGDLGARAQVRSQDEIGRVAAAFNTMAERREEAERLRKAMVGDVAHELRNPISTMRGTLEAAQDGLVPTDRSLVDSLMEETLLLQHVVEDLRDLAAADAGDLRIVRAPVLVAELLRQVAGVHLADAAAAGVRVLADAPDDLEVVGDVMRLRQLLGNLVTNAVRHTPPGGTVTLSGRREGDEVELAVTDDGEGIAAGDLPHVFERFWRADPSRTRASGGSGLGLAIVRQLAEAHGGTVSVASKPGDGARFAVRLPAVG
ncbi:HAMP domain-containing sensor histidine kinase [Nocardioides sp. 503]|uniref:HAMP domain-containing sensor histidine kinase n=1 Tax=Nocardioides sp. 503 TaxID=2508326 RepID=UPI001ADA7D5E|nr:HAMP domain-containing sensor histidine kinase [Nocardioides sp. 503]